MSDPETTETAGAATLTVSLETPCKGFSQMNMDQNCPEINLPVTLTSGTPLTMSSREIAELVEARHDSVKRAIERLVERGVIVQPPTVDEQDTDTMGRTRTTSVYRLEKRDSFVVVAQLSPEFTARLVDRWQQLEDEKANGGFGLPDLSDPVLLVQLLTEHASKRIEAEQRAQVAEGQVIEYRPKVEAYDSLMNADGLYGLQNAGRVLGARPNLFIRWLKQDYLFYQGQALVPRVGYIQRGLFEVKTKIIDDKARPETFVTPKGLDHLRDKVPPELMIGGAA